MLHRLALLVVTGLCVGFIGCTPAANVEPAPNEPENPWFDVALTGSVDDAEYAANADPNVRGGKGRTPLIEATWQGKPQAVDLLLANGANPNLSDLKGQTPLQYATKNYNDRTEVIDMLLAAGADPDATGSPYEPPLCLAAGNGRVDDVELLLAAGASLDATDRKGRDAMTYARNKGRGEVLSVLKEAEMSRRPAPGEMMDDAMRPGDMEEGGAILDSVQ